MESGLCTTGYSPNPMETEDPQTKDITHSRGVQAYRFEEGRLAETWWSLTEGHGSWLDK
jgi:hypothetical protein